MLIAQVRSMLMCILLQSHAGLLVLQSELVWLFDIKVFITDAPISLPNLSPASRQGPRSQIESGYIVENASLWPSGENQSDCQ